MLSDDPKANAALIALKVVPGSRRDQIVGPYGERLKVKVSAPPEDGRANKAVCELLAAALSVPARDVEIIAGHTSPEKTARIRGKMAAEVTEKLKTES